MIQIDGESLTTFEVEEVARYREKVHLDNLAYEKIDKASAFIDSILQSGKIVYGVNTGFGKLSETIISASQIGDLQENLIKSHSSGTGKPLSEQEVRAAIIVRANTLAKGNSGVRRITIEKLIELLNKDIYPYVPSMGSLGASGDLAPLAHIALLLIGRGRLILDGELVDFDKALLEKDFQPLDRLAAKEGLALINGTSCETGISALIIRESKYIFEVSLKAAALSMEALKSKSDAFDERIHKVRGIAEQGEVAARILKEIQGSALIDSKSRVQDAYTIRCIPQVYGAILKSMRFVEETIAQELNAATDNPLVFADDGDVISGGNFHAEPIAFAMDQLSIVLSEIGSITERRVNRLLNPVLSELPPFLSTESGVNSGLMILQYTAASLVSMNKILSHPASVDSIPVSADQEDHVSMGMNSVLKAREVLDNIKRIVAVELIAAAQAVDIVGIDKLGKGTREIYEKVRANVSFAPKDREFAYDLEKIYKALEGRDI
ncbi:MAG: histidine ammonia-lyase [Caldisericaceae bacterium]